MAFTPFKKMSAKLADEPDVRDPNALAAAIARKRMGKGKLQQMATKGRRPSA